MNDPTAINGVLADMRRKYMHARSLNLNPDWLKGEPLTVQILERWIPEVDALAARLAEVERERDSYAASRLRHMESIEENDAHIAQLEARLAEETAIVDRIWDIYGRPTYEQLAGRSIYDLINADRARLAEAERLLRQAWTGDHLHWSTWRKWKDEVNTFLRPADSADVAPCRTCGGSGAVDAPTSADDPSCPDCDGEGNIAVCEHCGSADAFDGMWHKSGCPTLNHPIQKPYPPMTGSGDGEGNAPKNSR